VTSQTLLQAVFFVVFTLLCTCVSLVSNPAPPHGDRTEQFSTEDDFISSQSSAWSKEQSYRDLDGSYDVSSNKLARASAAASFVRSFQFNETINLQENRTIYERSFSFPAPSGDDATASEHETELSNTHEFIKGQGQDLNSRRDFVRVQGQGQLSDIESSGSDEENRMDEDEDGVDEKDMSYPVEDASNMNLARELREAENNSHQHQQRQLTAESGTETLELSTASAYSQIMQSPYYVRQRRPPNVASLDALERSIALSQSVHPSGKRIRNT
jgi:hypothetical protein